MGLSIWLKAGRGLGDEMKSRDEKQKDMNHLALFLDGIDAGYYI